MSPMVRIEANGSVTTAATATKTAVQVAWSDMALRAVEMPRRAEPAMQVMTGGSRGVMRRTAGRRGRREREGEGG